MFRHKSTLNIRFSDIDAFGHVNNAKYLTYFEEARVEYFDEIVGWKYDLSKKGIILAKAEIDFIKPVHFRDEVFVHTRCARIGTKSFDLEYELIGYHEKKEILLADARTVMVTFDYNLHHSIEIPAEWKDAILKYEGGNVLVK